MKISSFKPMTMFRKIISVPVGILSIGVIGTPIAKLHAMIYPHSAGTIGHIPLTPLDQINFAIKLVCVFVVFTIGGVLTALIGRSRMANLIAGLLMTADVVVAALRVKAVYPTWLWAGVFILVIPCVLLGFQLVKKRIP
jgi:hypothetical protein